MFPNQKKARIASESEESKQLSVDSKSIVDTLKGNDGMIMSSNGDQLTRKDKITKPLIIEYNVCAIYIYIK